MEILVTILIVMFSVSYGYYNQRCRTLTQVNDLLEKEVDRLWKQRFQDQSHINEWMERYYGLQKEIIIKELKEKKEGEK